MKIKKTVTPRVLAANRTNSRRSTGPVTEEGKRMVSRNAIRHGLLSSKVVLGTAKKKAEYQDLMKDWMAEFRPKGMLENFLVEQIATTTWKLGVLETLESEALSRREGAADCITGIFTGNEVDLPIDSNDLPLDRSWDCKTVVVRAIAGNDHVNSKGSRQPQLINGQLVTGTQSSGNHHECERGLLEIRAVLGDSLDTLTRYRAHLEKQFFKAVETLRAYRQRTSRRPLSR
jgi:hypothetical protein